MDNNYNDNIEEKNETFEVIVDSLLKIITIGAFISILGNVLVNLLNMHNNSNSNSSNLCDLANLKNKIDMKKLSLEDYFKTPEGLEIIKTLKRYG